jgi:hypothetical protein
LLSLTAFLFYFLDGKLTSYKLIDDGRFEKSGYDAAKRSTPFEFAYDKPANQLAYEIDLSMNFSVSGLNGGQTLFSTSNEGDAVTLFIDSDSSLNIGYNPGGEKKSKIFTVVRLQKDRNYELNLYVAKNGAVGLSIDDKPAFKNKIGKKFDFSLIKAGGNYSGAVFDGKIEDFKLVYRAYKTSYEVQNFTAFILCLPALFFLIALFGVSGKIILLLKEIYFQTGLFFGAIISNVKTLSGSRTFYIFAAVVFLYVLPRIIADVPFHDDYFRITGGGFWDNDSRFLTGIIYRIISFNLFMVNIAPLSLIIGMIFLAASAYMLFKKWSGNDSPAALLSAFSLILSPIILFTVMSYQLDAVGMSFSFVFAAAVFLIPNSASLKFKVFVVFTAAFCIMLTHQSSIAVLAVFIFADFIILACGQNVALKESLNLFLIRIAGSVSSLAVWYISVGRSSRFGGSAIINESNILSAVFERVKLFTDYFFSSQPYGNFCTIIFAAIFLFFTFICFKTSRKIFCIKSPAGFLSSIITACSPAVLLFLGVVGANITTNFTQYISPTMLMSFSPFIACTVFIAVNFSGGIIKKALIALSALPLLYGFSLSYAYAKYLNYSYETNRIIVSSLLSDIDAGDKTIVVSNTTKDLPARIKKISDAFPAIHMVDGVVNIQRMHNIHLIAVLKFFGLDVKRHGESNAYRQAALAEAKKNVSQAQLVSAQYYYNLWRYKNLYVIDFTKSDSFNLDAY